MKRFSLLTVFITLSLLVSSLPAMPGRAYHSAVKAQDEVSNSPGAQAGSTAASHTIYLPLVTSNSGQLLVAETESDADGQVYVGLPDGQTAVFRLVGEVRQPIAGTHVTAIADSWGVTLIAVDDQGRYLPSLTSTPAVSLTLQSSTILAPAAGGQEIELHRPTVDGILVDDQSSLHEDHLRQLPANSDLWENEHTTYHAFFEVAPWCSAFVVGLFGKMAEELAHHLVIEFLVGETSPGLWENVTDYLHVNPAQEHLILLNEEQGVAIALDPDTSATGILFGQVVDGFTNVGVSGATVRLASDPGYATTTLYNGWYQLEGVPAGAQAVEAQASGYDGGAWVSGSPVTVDAGQATLAPAVELDSDSLGHEILLNGDFETGTAYPWSGWKDLFWADDAFIVDERPRFSPDSLYSLKLGGYSGEDVREQFSSQVMFMPAGTTGATLSYVYRIETTGSSGPEDYFYVDVCRYEYLKSICTGDLLGGPTVREYSSADQTDDTWVQESIDLFGIAEPDWNNLPRPFWLRFRSVPSSQDPVSTWYVDDVSVQVQEGEANVSMDQVYTTDYWGNAKTTFRPGEAILLALAATNHSNATLDVTYDWNTYDPDRQPVSYLTYEDWTVAMEPGEAHWHLDRGVSAGAIPGSYNYVATVSYGGTSSSGNATFDVQGTPIDANLLDALTCKDVQKGDPVDVTTDFTTGDSLIYTWTAWEGMEGPHTVRWDWHRPDGSLFYSFPYDTDADEALWHVWSWVNVSAMGSDFGAWSIDVYLDDVQVTTLYFTFSQGMLAGASAPADRANPGAFAGAGAPASLPGGGE
jgi:hypothetical protein